MTDRVIPILSSSAAVGPAAPAPVGLLHDALMRPLRDLRISVTDRCNFRCSYCMPKSVFDKNHVYLQQSALLSFEEITRAAKVFVAHGVRKLRLTGGEPLLRKNLDVLIGMLARLRTPDDQPLDITLTTNASLLAQKAVALKAAGLQRITVSLDGLDDAVFRAMNDVDFPVADVLAGIDAAKAAGLGPIKVNMVVKRGTNDPEILPMVRHFMGSGVVLRFIEYMDVGHTNGWRMDEVLPSAELIAGIRAHLPLVALGASSEGETAQRFGHVGKNGLHDPALGEIGVISSVTQAFCGDCNRARLSTEGKLYTCLFATHGHDLRSLLRSDPTDVQLSHAVSNLWRARSDQYSQLRALQGPPSPTSARRVEMSYIGG